MSGGTCDYSPVPSTNGQSTVVPDSGVEIYVLRPSGPGTNDPPAHYEKVWPTQPQQAEQK